MKKNNKKIYIISFVIICISFLIFISGTWLKSTFEGVSFEQYLFQILVPMEGTNTDTISLYIRDVSVLFAAFIVVYHFSFIKFGKIQTKLDIRIYKWRKSINVFPFKRNPKVYFRVAIASLILSFAWFVISLGMVSYVKSQIDVSTLFEDNYVDPNDVEITFPEKKRNLILINLESMESTYTSKENGGNLKENLIPELTQIAKSNINFSNTNLVGGARPITGTGWTIAGLVSQSAGLPLKVPIDGNTYGNFKTFLNGAVSLGDILKTQGYNQEIMVGSDIKFGGRDKFYSLHGDYEIFDYNTAKEREYIDKDYFVWWGIEDSKLFSYAKQEILDLASEEQPFNFTMLTVNTHFVGGYLEKGASKKYEDQYSNTINYSSKQVYEFVEWIKKQDFYKNTTVIILGDHLTMDTEFINNNVEDDYIRTVYNAFLNTEVKPINMKNRTFTTMDFYPTILASLNVSIKGNRLGLGTNLFSEEKTLAEKLGYKELNEQLKKRSVYYNSHFLYSNETSD